MEILIAGGILVALMVYLSTKIKRTAAAAYERETIETGEFKLVKPEGFLNPVKDDPFTYEARSKDYGETRAARDTPQASFVLSLSGSEDFEAFCREAKASAGKIISEKLLTDEARRQKIYLLEAEKTENEIGFAIFRKIVESDRPQRGIYDLKISVLQDFRSRYGEQVTEILDGFNVK